MNGIPASVFLGPLFMAAFFVIILVMVAGVKLLLFYFVKDKNVSEKIIRRPRKRKPKPITPTDEPVRSIEIDPEKIDKIYVKKVS